jgi:wyosine [tRNA(Phe)-imidazoG37] synthetase (radical SAM superfamily)
MANNAASKYPSAFGPVPSRRLGRSLGINNIPPKMCSYSCVYCQLGRTLAMRTERDTFYSPDAVVSQVEAKVNRLSDLGGRIDYLTFVADGEPTLDENLGQEIRRLRPLGINIAVITNASLIAREDVQADLSGADWVSLKVDTVHHQVWNRLNRPHKALDQDRIMQGMLEFRHKFQGQLVTETMLVRGLNDGEQQLQGIASFLRDLAPDKAYLAIPTRPPAVASVCSPTDETLGRAFRLLQEHLPSVEYLIGYEGNTFAATGSAAHDLLSITAVHPMKKEAVEELLARSESDWTVVSALIAQGALVEARYEGEVFYLRTG